MARVVAYVPDLLFGSQVLGALRAGDHEVELVSVLERLDPGVDVLIVDLTADPGERIAQVEALPTEGVKLLAFYSHVEAEVRSQAEEAGFDLVVPRSRMAREGSPLVARLAAGPPA